MKKIILALAVGAIVILGARYFLQSQAQTEPEERTVYENNVVKSIEKQLAGLPLEEIRKKENRILEKSIEEIQASVEKGELTYTEITAFYLDRIQRFDKSEKGLNAVVEINPSAIEEAKKLDADKNATKNPMYGIPVLVKDNINTSQMATSAGTVALKDFKPATNAPVVDNLIQNKAILLGKANLSELANFVDTRMPSGYSSRLGQTLSPFQPLRLSPSGSSTGSAVAVAANFSAVALGTETTGSIISPSAVNSIVGFKPSKDWISTEGVVPLSSTMDTVGPMTKTVKDAVALFNASVQNPSNKITLDANPDGLKNKRIGVLPGENRQKLVEALKKAGATPVDIEWNEIDNEFILLHDFRPDFDAYAKKYGTPVKSLADLVEFNKKDLKRNAKYGQDLLEDAVDNKNEDGKRIRDLVQKTQAAIQKIWKDHQLDAIAFMNSDGVTNPCIAGYPLLTVPFGNNEFEEPIGATFTALHGQDEALANLAFAFEAQTNARQIPTGYLKNQ